MGLAPPRTCPVPKCGQPNCQRHRPAAAWRTRTAPPPARITGRRLQRLREELFDRYPWCVECAREGRQTPATIRDHRVPLAEGGRDDDTNAQALCRECSDRKTADEAWRGRQRRR